MNPRPLCLWLRLEQQLQSELNLARGANDRSDGSLVCIDGSRRAEDTLSRHVEVGVVQDIEQLGAETEGGALGDRGGLDRLW